MRLFGLPLVVAVIGCGTGTFFECLDAAQCGDEGRCEANGACSFPDDTCESGRRYGEHSAAGVARQCVPPDAEALDSTSAADGDEGSTWSSDTLRLDDDGSTRGELTTGPPNGTTDALGTDDGETEGEPNSVFFDDFERPDSVELGNGWWEKTPSAFEIESGRVVRVGPTSSYPNNLVLRPEVELVADVEFAVTFHPNQVDGLGHPQLHGRVQLADHDAPGGMTGYLLFIGSGTLDMRRQEGSSVAAHFYNQLTDPIAANATYRLRFVIRGDDPVHLEGYLEELGDDDQWLPHTELHASDGASTRVVDPGLVGFSAHTHVGTFTYDDSWWTTPPGSGP